MNKQCLSIYLDFFLLFFGTESHFVTEAEVQCAISPHCNLRLPGSSNSHALARHYHTQLIFIFLIEMGFHHVGQAGLELLTSGDPPALASKVLGLQA